MTHIGYVLFNITLEETEVLLIPIFKKSSCTEKRIPSCASGLISFLVGYKEIFLYLDQKNITMPLTTNLIQPCLIGGA